MPPAGRGIIPLHPFQMGREREVGALHLEKEKK